VPRPRFSRKTLESWQNTKGPLGGNVQCMGMRSRGEGENEGTYERENFEFTSLSPRPLREISRAPFFAPARCVLLCSCLSPFAVTANFPTSLRLAGAACFLAIYVHVNILQNERAASRCASWTILHPAFVTRDAKLWEKYRIRPQILGRGRGEAENLRMHLKRTDSHRFLDIPLPRSSDRTIRCTSLDASAN